MGCHASPGPSHSSGGGGFLHFLKAVGNFVYHNSGASDVVGCVTHPSWSGCGRAAFDVAALIAGGSVGSLLASTAERLLAQRVAILAAGGIRTVMTNAAGDSVRVTTFSLIRGRVTPGAYLRALPVNQVGSKLVKLGIMKAGNAVGAGNAIGAGMEGVYDFMSQPGSPGGSPHMSPACARFGSC
jgi:hypothetical protein